MDPMKCNSVFSYLHNADHDICLLQECNIRFRLDYKQLEDRWTYGQSIWSGDNNNKSSGVAILFRGNDLKVLKTQEVVNGRLIYADVKLDNICFRVINVYCPTDLQGRKEVLKAIIPLLICGKEVILGGDFNCSLSQKDRNSSSNVYLDSSSQELIKLVKDFGLVDSFRFKHPDIPGYSWTNGRSYSRIDFLFTSSRITILNSGINSTFFSDHAKVDVELEFEGVRARGMGFWKLNISLLLNQEVVRHYKEKLSEWKSLQPLYNSMGEWWEDCKIRTKFFFMKEGKRIKKGRAFACKLHQKRLQQFYTMAHSGFDVIDDIMRLKKSISDIYAEQSRSFMIRSRLQHMESNEKCTRYFFKKVLRSRTVIDELKKQDNELITETKDLISYIHFFFQDLFSEKEMDEETMGSFLSESHIEEELLIDMEKDFTTNDLTKALNSMKGNKCPGMDGLPKEFYVKFWEELKDTMLVMFKESLNLGKLPPTLREGMVSVLYKKGDKSDLKNWRPLTLLGTDVKILSKAIFFRLQPIMSCLIGDDQTCGIKGRSLQQNLALIRDSFLYAQDRKIPLCILGLDLEKAFDSIDHRFLRKVLQSSGLGKSMYRWINLLYTECQSRILVNGHLSPPIMIRSGVRQGCGLSPLLFVLAIEPLAQAIRQHSELKGLVIPGSLGKEAKLSLYMDDLTLLLTNNHSVEKVLQICDRFMLATGMKINRSKSEILYLNWTEPKQYFGLKNQDKAIKILGMVWCKDMEERNWNSRLHQIEWKIKQWEERDLTLKGKVLIINAEIIASLTYVAATLPAPRRFLSSVKKMMFRFLWGSNQEKLKREIVYKKIEKGGLAVPDIEVKFDAMILLPIIKACLTDEEIKFSSFFARFWVGQEIRRLWNKRTPQNIPHAEIRPAMYDRLLCLIKLGSWSNIPIANLNRSLIEGKLSPLLLKMTPVGKLIESECTKVWKNVNDDFLFNCHKDIAWQVVQNCLPTRVFLKKRNCTRTILCPRTNCGEEETIRHCLWECSYAQKVWNQIRPWLLNLYRMPSEGDIWYGELKEVHLNKWIRWWAIINIFKEALWKSRNICVFQTYEIPVISVVKSSLRCIGDYIVRDAQKLSADEIDRIWNIPSVSPFNKVWKIG